MSNTAVLVWCVNSALEHRSDPCVQDWLHSTQLSQILLSLAHDICFNKTDMEAKHILECCFDKIRGGGMYTFSNWLQFFVILSFPFGIGS